MSAEPTDRTEPRDFDATDEVFGPASGEAASSSERDESRNLQAANEQAREWWAEHGPADPHPPGDAEGRRQLCQNWLDAARELQRHGPTNPDDPYGHALSSLWWEYLRKASKSLLRVADELRKDGQAFAKLRVAMSHGEISETAIHEAEAATLLIMAALDADTGGGGREPAKAGGWSQAELIQEVEEERKSFSASTFRRIREAAGVKPTERGKHDRRYKNAEIRRMADAAEAGKFHGGREIATIWRNLLKPQTTN